MKFHCSHPKIYTNLSYILCLKRKTLLLYFFFLSYHFFASGQTIWFVKANATGLNNGTNWANAFTDLQPAIDAALASTDFNRQVWVAAGTYKPTQMAGNGTEQRDKSFTLVQNVKLYGGFIGTEPANYNLSLRNVKANATMLSGDIGIVNDVADNSYHVVISAGPLGSTRLDGFTIKGGNANGTTGSILFRGENFERSYCGGLYSRQNDDGLTIVNCIFETNSGTHYGGIYNFSSSPKIINCIIRNNIATARGNNAGGAGGLSNKNNSNPVVTNCLITGNKGDDGGGVTNNLLCSATFINCSIAGNTALGAPGENNDNATGGGIQNYAYSTSNIYNCIIWGNTARADSNLSSQDANSPFIIVNSIIEGGYTGTNILNDDPVFVSPVAAINAPTAAGDYHIKCNSPAINTGNNFSYPSGMPTDLDGNTRMIGAVLDMGAYEFQTALSQNIVVQAISPGFPFRYCPGTAIAVSFTINDCPGNFAANNIFTLQLSDANGSFVSPVSIGTLASALPGTINATIPVSVTPGNDYRIKIISSNQSFSSPEFNITITILSIQIPAIAINASATQICAGDNVVFTASFSNGGTTPLYQWKKNGINVGTNSNTYSVNNLTGTDIITCALTNTESCSVPANVVSNAISIAVTNVTPAISITVINGNICSGETANFSAAISGAGNSPIFQWKKNGVNVGGNVASYSSPGLSSADIITCELASSAACASPAKVLSNALQVNVAPIVVPAIMLTGDKNEICPGEPVTFLATIINGGGNPIFQWKKNGINVATSSSSYTDASLISTDVISCKFLSNARCAVPQIAASNVLMVRVGLITPAITIQADRAEICKGERLNFSAIISAGGNAPVYQWKKNGIKVGTNSPSWSDAALLNSDIISCSLTSNAGCISQAIVESNELQVTINSLPVIKLSKSNDINCAAGQSMLLATGGIKYEWQPAEGIETILVANPIVHPSQSTVFNVKVTTDKNCSATKAITVNVTSQGKYEIPNSFTPNNDGINDCFGVGHLQNISNLDFSIYNRWGQKIFYTTNPTQCWDGRNAGYEQGHGVYIYVVKANGACGLVNRKGTVLLIR